MKKFSLVLILTLIAATGAFAQVDAPIPEGKVQIIDNFENGNYWIWAGSDWDRWGGHKISWGADLHKAWVSEGKYSLELKLEPVPAGGESGTWFYDGSQDLSGGKYVVIDFYNPSPIVHSVSFILQTGDAWNWNQTQSYYLPQGQHTIVFDIQSFEPERLAEVKRISISSWVGTQTNYDTSIFIDNIRLIK